MTTKQEVFLERIVESMFPPGEGYLETLAKRDKLKVILRFHLAGLLEDKERLDWLDGQNLQIQRVPTWEIPVELEHITEEAFCTTYKGVTIRQAITKAMKGEI